MKTRSIFAVLLLTLVVLLVLAGGAPTLEAQPTEQPGETPLPPGTEQQAPQEEATQKVFFYNAAGELVGVDREVTGGPQVAGFTMNELVKGPSEEERAQGYYTLLPEGVRSLYYTESQDGKTFSVTLSDELLSLKGNESARLALAQVLETGRAVSGAETVAVMVGGIDAYEALDAGPAPGAEAPAGSGESSGLWWIILLIVLGILTVTGTTLGVYTLLRQRRKAAVKRTKPMKGPANRKARVSRPAPPKRRRKG
ncbi:MAG: GerMN domain-containing protein [Candidatus Geothermincolia bacterium]